MNSLGEPTRKYQDVYEYIYVYITPSQKHRFHLMVHTESFRVQLVDPESP